MPWLIDAANLGGVLGGAAGARNSQAILAALLPWARERKQVVVVFDGPESPGMATRLGGIEIVWSGSRSADDVISKRIAAIAGGGKSAKSWTVITNDQSLARRCRDLGAKSNRPPSSSSAPPSRNRDREPPGAPRPPPTNRLPNAKEIAHWREVFGGKKRTSKGKEERKSFTGLFASRTASLPFALGGGWIHEAFWLSLQGAVDSVQ